MTEDDWKALGQIAVAVIVIAVVVALWLFAPGSGGDACDAALSAARGC